MKRNLKLLSLILLLIFLTGTLPGNFAKAEQSNSQSWVYNNFEKSGNYTGVACDENGVFVLVGDNGIIKSSTDSVNWQDQMSGTAINLSGVAAGNGKFVVVGDNGTILLSHDGSNWQKVYFDNVSNIQSITFGNQKFIAICKIYTDDGYLQRIISSIDGTNWKISSESTSSDYKNIKFVGNIFYAYGQNDYAYSEDAINWNYGKYSETVKINDIIWDETGKCYIGSGNASELYSSNDAVNWVYLTVNLTSGVKIQKIIKYKSDYLIFASKGRYSYILKGQLTNYADIGNFYGEVANVFIDGDNLVSVGKFQTIINTNDGETFQITQKRPPDFYKTVWNGQGYLSISNDGRTFKSNDGVQWSSYSNDLKDNLTDFVWADDKYIAIAEVYDDYGNSECKIYSSIDGEKWVKINWLIYKNIHKIKYLNKKYFGLSSKGEIIVSNDAITWSSYTLTDDYINDIVWDGQKYICVCDNGLIFTSFNGEDFIKERTNIKEDIYTVAFNGQKLVATGANGTLLVSTNGKKWEKIDFGDINAVFLSSIWNGDKFIFLDIYGGVFESTDLQTIQLTSFVDIDMGKLVWNGEKYLAMGNDGGIASFLPLDLIKIKVNNVPVLFDVAPLLNNGRTMIPLRGVLEKMGATVDWDNDAKTAIVKKGNQEIKLKLGSISATVNGISTTLDTPPIFINGRTLVPLRFISENLNAEVRWDSSSRTVDITI